MIHVNLPAKSLQQFTSEEDVVQATTYKHVSTNRQDNQEENTVI